MVTAKRESRIFKEMHETVRGLHKIGLIDNRPHYTLAELLAASDYSQPQLAEEREWVNAPPVGGELI